MRSKRTKQFRTLFDELPDAVRTQANHAYRLFNINPAHPGLDFKQVSKRGQPTLLALASTIGRSPFARLTIGSGSGLAAMPNTTNCSTNYNKR